MRDTRIHEKPSHVQNAAGEVIMDGPDGVAVSMTPEAASMTAARLIDNAAEAKGKQQIEDDLQQRRTRSMR
jgi:hypothetical protein